MVAENDQPSIPARRLAERLRDLREREHLTQKQLARTLGGADALSIATISLWEKPGSDRLPPPQRLATYARLFCTSRSFSGDRPRLLSSGELTEQERERESELYDELIALRERAQSTNIAAPVRAQRSAIWHFPDPIAVSIVCSDAVDPPPYAQHGHLNYSRYAKYADLDALVEVFGQVKADSTAGAGFCLEPPDPHRRRGFRCCEPVRTEHSAAGSGGDSGHRSGNASIQMHCGRGDAKVRVDVGRGRNLGAGRWADRP
jgi:transcriptional regulator with XRE-family HTH domain